MSKNKKPDQNLELLIRLIGAVGQFLIDRQLNLQNIFSISIAI